MAELDEFFSYSEVPDLEHGLESFGDSYQKRSFSPYPPFILASQLLDETLIKDKMWLGSMDGVEPG